LKCIKESLPKIKEKITNHSNQEKLNKQLNKIERSTFNILQNKDKIESNLAFHFVEGNLIKVTLLKGRQIGRLDPDRRNQSCIERSIAAYSAFT
jgi:hypothetical protein